MSEESKQNTTMMKDLTVGSIPKLMVVFALPLFVSNALQAIYNIVDMMVVGQVIGGTGMSAVATGGNILNILTFIVMGFSSAGQVIIARAVGAKDMDAVRKTIGTMFTMLITIAILISVACFFVRTPLLHLVKTPEEAFKYTMDYTLVCISGLVFIYGYNIISAIMRGMGDSKRPFMFVAIASIINIVLDILFVAVLHMEVIGAALATVIGQAVSFIFSLIYLYRKKESFGFDFKLRSFKIDGKTMGALVSLGIPMALQSAAITISMTVVAAWVNSFGVVASACAGILNKINMMVGVLGHSLSTAAASMVGQNLGARKYKRIPKILIFGTSVAVVIEIIYTILILTAPQAIFGLFTGDPEILQNAYIIIIPSIISAFGAASRCFAFGIINGSGNSKLNLLVAILDGVIARISLAYILGWTMGLGPQGFWMGDAIAGFVPFIIGFVFYISGRWKK